MRSYKKLSVGIKELKDRASEIIALVQRTGQSVDYEESARSSEDYASTSDAHERLIAAGLAQPGPKPRLLSELKPKPLRSDASRAIDTIVRDREDE